MSIALSVFHANITTGMLSPESAGDWLPRLAQGGSGIPDQTNC